MEQFSPAALDRIRKERGLTLTELAAIAGISKWTMYNYRSGLYVPRADRVPMMAAALQVPVGDLFEESPDA